MYTALIAFHIYVLLHLSLFPLFLNSLSYICAAVSYETRWKASLIVIRRLSVRDIFWGRNFNTFSNWLEVMRRWVNGFSSNDNEKFSYLNKTYSKIEYDI